MGRNISRSVAAVILAALAILAAAPSASRAHEVVLHVGRSAAGQLKISADLSHPIGIPQSIFSGIPGSSSARPPLITTPSGTSPPARSARTTTSR